MPTNRTRIRRGRVPELTPHQFAYLLDRELPEPDSEDKWWRAVEARADNPDGRQYPRTTVSLWRAHADELLNVWRFEDGNHGKRPSVWWDSDAPRMASGTFRGRWYDGQLAEPRRRLGGKGTPKHEVLNYVPYFCCGIPTFWIDQRDLETWPSLTCEPIDPNDPPIYEAEAVYLERHRLLLPGEKRLLRKKDFAPEAIELEDEDVSAIG